MLDGGSMYYPYFRGKQFELITIKENANLIEKSNFVPIIEPVKESISGLHRTTDALINANARFILIVNPVNGDWVDDHDNLFDKVFNKKLTEYKNYMLGFLLTENTSMTDIATFCNNKKIDISFIHYGFNHGKELATQLNSLSQVKENIFIEDVCQKLYRKNFESHIFWSYLLQILWV